MPWFAREATSNDAAHRPVPITMNTTLISTDMYPGNHLCVFAVQRSDCLCEDDGVEINREPRRPDVTSLELVGGPEALEVKLCSYDEAWADIFLHHRGRIREALAGQDVLIEHIGSTSVPGLAAKPIVDVVVGVDDVTAEEDYLDQLLAIGYELRVREPGHRLVRTQERDLHVHIYHRGDVAIAEYLLLRDHLRRDARDRALYERTKRTLMTQRWEDMNDYAAAKTDVIQAIKARARSAHGL